MTLQELKAKLIEFGVPSEIIQINEDEDEYEESILLLSNDEEYIISIEDSCISLEIWYLEDPDYCNRYTSVFTTIVDAPEQLKQYLQDFINL